jgi:hypothetical protein
MRSSPARAWVTAGQRAGAASLLALGVAVLLVSLPSAAAGPLPTGGPAYTPTAWGNGVVECSFAATAPIVTVSPAYAEGSGLVVGMSSLTQAAAGGLLAATASFAGATWVAVNLSTGSEYALAYSTTVPVYQVLLSTVGLEVGKVSVSIAFSIADTAGTGANRVAVNLTVNGWPWQLDPGALEANLSLAVAATASEHMTASGSPVSSILSVANSTGNETAEMLLPAEANATSSTGVLASIPIVGSLAESVASAALLTVTFGSPANGAKSISYAPMMEVPEKPIGSPGPGPGPGPGPRPGPGSAPGGVGGAGIPLSYLVTVGAVGLAVCLGVAEVTRRLRHAPSRLEFVEEDET